jgi:hypothetical protein
MTRQNWATFAAPDVLRAQPNRHVNAAAGSRSHRPCAGL